MLLMSYSAGVGYFVFVKAGLPELCIFFSANYALFFGELYTKNPELRGFCNIAQYF